MTEQISDAIDEEDDFSDEGDSGEEDWETYEEEYAGENNDGAGPAARKSSFNKIVIGIAVVVALGVGGFTILGGGNKNAAVPSAQPGQLAGNVPAAPPGNQQVSGIPASPETDTANTPYGIAYGEQEQPQSPSEESKKSTPGLLHNPALLEEIRSGEPAAKESDQETPQRDEGQYAAAPRIVEGVLPMPAPITQNEQEGGEELIPMPMASAPEQDLNKEALSLQADQEPAPNEREQPFSADHDMEQNAVPAEITQRLDDIIQRLNAMESGLAHIDSLQDTLDDLERRMDKIEKTAPQKTGAAPEDTIMRRRTEKEYSPPEKVGIPASATAEWVLKAAQPGQAMVAQKGKGDMVTVKVGDTLAGIGRITAISMQNGGWVVQGEKGRITQ